MLPGLLLPSLAWAQGGAQAVTLGELNVVATTPVSGTGGGGGQSIDKVPFTVETVSARQLEIDQARLDPTFTLARTTPGVNLSDGQGNSFRQTLTYRGFDASPLQGAPQGLAVYQNGTRINEAFGDVVNWDLIPSVAINRIDIVTGNPIFGLNALGGAVNIEMKNGFTWQGKEVSVIGGSDGRILGTLQYGEVIGPWSFYFAGEGLRDQGWRFRSPSEIGRVYADLGYRTLDSEFHLIATGAKTFFGAAAATPVDFSRADERAIFTSPQTIATEMGQIQLTGKVNVSPTWDVQGNAYVRRFSQFVIDGNDGNFENCSRQSNFRGSLCFEDDGFVRAPGQSAAAFRNQFRIVGPAGQLIPFRDVPYGTLDTVRTEATSYGGTLQAVNRDRVFDRPNTFIVGGSVDAADYSYKAASTLGVINPDLSVTTNPDNPNYGNIPGLGTGPIRTAAALGIAPSSVRGTNLYLGLYALDTFDLTDDLSLTAGARLNFARISTQDQTGFSPDVNGTHYFNRINPVAGLTYKVVPGVNFYGGYSESNRAPTPLELACANPDRPCLLPNSLVADPPLRQVVARTGEVGFRGTIADFYGSGGTFNYKVGAFQTNLTDDILQLAVPGNAARGFFVNVPATRRQGIEVSGEYLSGPLAIYANYALIDATFQFNGDLSSPNNPQAVDGLITVRPGNQLPLVPNHQIKAGFDYAITPFWRFGMNFQAFSSSYFRGDESNINRKLPAYFTANLNTSFQVTPQLQVFALMTNIFNNRYANFGTFAEQGAVAGNFVINDPRTTTLVQPLSVYGGLRYAFGADPAPMPEPIIRKY